MGTDEHHALSDDERNRAILSNIGELAMILVGLATVARLPGDYELKRAIMLAGFVAGVSNACAHLIVRTGRPLGAMYVLKLPLAVVAGLLLLYFGPLSLAVAVLAVGLYVYGLSGSRVVAWATLGLCSGGYLAVMLLQNAGWLSDNGLVAAAELTSRGRLTAAVIVEVAFGLIWVLARASRRSMERAIDSASEAARQASQRQAQLVEAAQQLDVVLRAGRARAGERVGPWALSHLLGRGGMGEVYAATHSASGQAAAIKLVSGDGTHAPDLVQRLKREAEALSRLDHLNVVKVFEVGETSAGAPYIAMEQLRGIDLAELLRQRATLTLDETVALVRQVAQALEAAREANIVHRDLKPQNVFRVEGATPHWKVLDFGIAKLGGHAMSLTHGEVMGTPGYMAPEYLSGEPIDHRADVFSLAVLTYRCLVGLPPFVAERTEIISMRVLHWQPPRPRLTNAHADVERALAWGLAKRPADRPQTALAFAQALELSTRGALPEEHRQRVERLLAEATWGAEVRTVALDAPTKS